MVPKLLLCLALVWGPVLPAGAQAVMFLNEVYVNPPSLRWGEDITHEAELITPVADPWDGPDKDQWADDWLPAPGARGEMSNGNNWPDTATEQWIRGEAAVGTAAQGYVLQYFYDNEELGR